MITTETKQQITKDLGKSKTDTGSAEVQIGILTARILELTEHSKKNPKDNHSRRGLLQMVGQRKKLLKYLSENDFESYQNVIKKLGLRR
jgi:small subunit ribosomal protein S15